MSRTPVGETSPGVWFSPYDYHLHEDPYPTYARMRDEAPLYRNDELDFWALSRHGDVAAAFRDPGRYSNANGVTLDPAAWGPNAARTMSFLAMDSPQHTRLRSLVSKVFTPRRVRELEPRIRELTLLHLEPALDRGRFDFVADFAGLLPMDVISELLGVPEADRTELRRLSDVVVSRDDGVVDVPVAGMEAALHLAQYYADLVAERRRRPGTDLVSSLIQAEADAGGDRLTDDEIIGFLFLMVVAGNETTTKLLANAVYWSWRNPDQAAAVLARPDLVPSWVEETLRYDTSTQSIARTVTEDFEAHGRKVSAGDRMLLLIGSANRDSGTFADGDRYDVHRAPDAQALVSFGAGPHYCLGAALARLEGRVALDELVRRVGAFDVDEAGARRVHSSNVRGFATLPVTLRGR